MKFYEIVKEKREKPLKLSNKREERSKTKENFWKYTEIEDLVILYRKKKDFLPQEYSELKNNLNGSLDFSYPLSNAFNLESTMMDQSL